MFHQTNAQKVFHCSSLHFKATSFSKYFVSVTFLLCRCTDLLGVVNTIQQTFVRLLQNSRPIKNNSWLASSLIGVQLMWDAFYHNIYALFHACFVNPKQFIRLKLYKITQMSPGQSFLFLQLVINQLWITSRKVKTKQTVLKA